jgi:hypothetical protein
VEILGEEIAADIARDEAAEAFYVLIRAVEREGHDVASVLARVLNIRELDTAESIAQVMHWRVARQSAMRTNAPTKQAATLTRCPKATRQSSVRPSCC